MNGICINAIRNTRKEKIILKSLKCQKETKKNLDLAFISCYIKRGHIYRRQHMVFVFCRNVLYWECIAENGFLVWDRVRLESNLPPEVPFVGTGCNIICSSQLHLPTNELCIFSHQVTHKIILVFRNQTALKMFLLLFAFWYVTNNCHKIIFKRYFFNKHWKNCRNIASITDSK